MSDDAAPRTGGEWPHDALLASMRARLGARASRIGLVLGSGLGGIADAAEDRVEWAADELPGYPRSTVAGHDGRLILGRFGGVDTWIVKGRVHLYEGHEPETVTRYVRLLRAHGVRTLILTNAAGSLVREIEPGSICRVDDVLNLFLRPLARPAQPSPLFRRRAPLVDPALSRMVERVAREQRIALRAGVLCGSPGPNYETASEVRAARLYGAHLASMSTVPEALLARELGMRVLIFSSVTNYATGLSPTPLTHGEVVTMADHAGQDLRRLLEALLPQLQ